MTNIKFQISKCLANRLKKISSMTGQSEDYYIRLALKEKIAELEDFYLAIKSYKKVLTKKSRVWSQQELVDGVDF